jgi:hypothetical protein
MQDAQQDNGMTIAEAAAHISAYPQTLCGGASAVATCTLRRS